MAARRRTRTSARPRRSARASSSSTSPNVVLFGSLGLGLLVLVAVFAMGANREPAAAEGDPTAGASATPAVAQGGSAQARPAEAAAGRTGTPPGRAAPELTDAHLAAAEERYERAKDLWNDAQKARQAGRTAEYQKILLVCWDELNAMLAEVEEQADWFDEADFEGWALPPAYVRLQRRFDAWDKLRAKVKRVKPAKRRR